MPTGSNKYYVYVYIDPRNLEEFYYGKGKGDRKKAHLSEFNGSEKYKRIQAIKNEGLEPIIKVIAKGLSEKEALLVEKTLIWKLGKNLTNISSGHFSDNFRPHHTLHKNISGFDYENGIYYVNVGEGIHRCWTDCKKLGFLSAGQGTQWSKPIRTLEKGDIVVPYLKNRGYVGIGKVIAKAVKVKEFKKDGISLNKLKLKQPNIFCNCDNENSEYLVKIKWIITVEEKEAKWKKKSNLFTSQLIKVDLMGQQETLRFLENEFKISFEELLLKNEP